MWRRLLESNTPAAALLIRLIAGGTFLSEGIQKILFPAEAGAGRFAKMGYKSAEFLAPFVGVTEILCGALVLLGLLTRLAAVPLITIMIMAILSTKIPILLEREFLGFALRELKYYGFWGMAHEARTDFAMLLSSLFLLITGAGKCSLDALLTKRLPAPDTRHG